MCASFVVRVENYYSVTTKHAQKVIIFSALNYSKPHVVRTVYMTVTSKTVLMCSLLFIVILALLFIYCRYIFIIAVLMNDMT